MFQFVETQVRAGQNLAAMRLLLAGAAWCLPPIRAFRKASALLLEGRLLIEYNAQRPAAAESIFYSYAKRRQLTFWAITSYAANVVEKDKARRLDQILGHRKVSAGAKAVLARAKLRSQQGGNNPLGASQDSGGDHERLAEDGLSFMQAEDGRIDLETVIATAVAAEAADREDIFAAAIDLLLRQVAEIEKDRSLSGEHLQDVFVAKLTLFDLEGAERFLSHAYVSGMKKATRLRAELTALQGETASCVHVIRRARQDILARAAGERRACQDRPVVVYPAAALRKNRIDYQGFRADIRFVLSSLVDTLESNQIAYDVRGRIKTHGYIDLPVPNFTYHTISRNGMGLHFKETDRPSLFSFDRRGYSGWSEFSEITMDELQVAAIDPQEAAAFFEDEQQRVIGGNLSKYRQADVSNAEALPDRFIFVALQLIGDAVSQLAYVTLFEMVEEVVTVAEAQGLSVVIKRHPLCNTPEVSRFLAKLVAEGRVVQVYSSIHAIIPRSVAVCVINSGVGAEALLHERPVYVFGRSDYMGGCFVCRQKGDFAEQFSEGKSRLTRDELRTFWFMLRKHYAIDLRDREKAAAEIGARVMKHLEDCKA